jgi:hypothetical protein
LKRQKKFFYTKELAHILEKKTAQVLWIFY